MTTRVLTIALAAAAALTTVASQSRPDYPFKPVPFTSVDLNDVFWAPRIETNRQVTIPAAFQQCERTNRVYHFERAAKVRESLTANRHFALPVFEPRFQFAKESDRAGLCFFIGSARGVIRERRHQRALHGVLHGLELLQPHAADQQRH